MSIISAITEFLKTHSLGLTAAAASTSFATWMLITGGPGANGPQVDITVAHAPVDNPMKQRPEEAIMPSRMKLSSEASPAAAPLITGSLKEEAHKDRPRTVPARRAQPATGNGDVPHYVLRFATRQLALLEGAGRLWSVEPGDELPGAGRVMRIVPRDGGKWAVETFDGKHRHVFVSE